LNACVGESAAARASPPGQDEDIGRDKHENEAEKPHPRLRRDDAGEHDTQPGHEAEYRQCGEAPPLGHAGRPAQRRGKRGILGSQ